MALVDAFVLHELLPENSGVKVGRKNGGGQGGSMQEFPRNNRVELAIFDAVIPALSLRRSPDTCVGMTVAI